MPLVCLGLSHHEAPAEVRERHTFPPDRMAEALVALLDYNCVREAAMLSTCNRMEIYANITDVECGVEQLKEFLVNFRHGDVTYDIEPYLYALVERAAVEHLMRVATGLDSMLIGEAEILGQVKEAYHQAQRARSLGKALHRLFRDAIKAGKAARSSTAIGNESVSLATVAVAMARSHVGQLEGKNVVLLGAGKMGRTAAKRLKLEGARGLVVVNRTYDRARELVVQLGIGEAANLTALPGLLADADIVITLTGARHFVLTEPLIAQAMRGRSHRPLCLIDIAVPRDIDPAVRSIAGVSLIDIDKLEEPVHDTLVHRQQAVPLVERIIEAHVDAFERWYAADVGQPVVPSLGRMAEALREAELERLFARCPDLDRRQRTLVIGLSLRIVSKLLHPLISSMRGAGDDPAERAARARFIEETFGLFNVETTDEQESPLAGA